MPALTSFLGITEKSPKIKPGVGLLHVDIDGWLAELPLIAEYYESFGEHMPGELVSQLEAMRERLNSAKD